MLEQGIDFELPSANNSPSKVVEVVSENSSNSEGLKTESSNEEMSDKNSSNDECDESDLESYARYLFSLNLVVVIVSVICKSIANLQSNNILTFHNKPLYSINQNKFTLRCYGLVERCI